MASRTTQTVARFSFPFRLPGFPVPQPAGKYRVEHDEALIEAVSRHACRRPGAVIHLPAIGRHASAWQMVPVDPADLRAALEKDHEHAMTAIHFRQTYTRPVRRAAATHLFAVGQAVRMKAGFIKSATQSPDIYRVTCVLPPQGTSFQYRIRNDEERHERVTTEDNLEPVDRN